MAGSGDLMFRAGITFDKEGAIVSDMSKILKNLQLFADGKPIVEKINFDTSGFKHFEESFKRSNETIREMRKTLEQAFAAIPNKDKFSDTNFTKLTDSARQLLYVINQLKVAEETYAKSASQILKERQRSIDAEIKANDRKTASVRAGVIDTQKQIDSVNMLTHQYERLVPILNAIAQKRVNVKVDIDKAYQADLDRINREIDRLRRLNLTLGAKGDVSAIKANLDTIRLLEEEIKKINKTKIDLFNMDKVQSDFARIQSLTAQTFGELQNATRKLGADNSLNAALEAQSQKVLQLHERIKALDAEIARMNATGRLYDSSGGFTTEATAKLQERMALTKQLTQESISGQQAQIQYERQLQEEKRRTEQQAKESAREAARIAKEEADARKRAQDAANAENKARQASYNARKQQGREIQRILKAEENSIDAITKKLQVQQQRLSTTTFGSAKFDKIIAEVDRLTKKLQEAQNKINELTGKTVSGANQQAAAVKKVNTAMQKQHSYLENLIRRMTIYASIGAVGGFLKKIREVTAQFELQRVSLGAIIQDQNRANQLFSEIKQFALKSPVKILDLTKYVKQVAAYRIETDKLFDTTKRLADVSVGLGVDMQRIVLAYGQVKAASYLRAAEVRQFAEAGIPLLELLSEKFTEVEGHAVSTEEVMERISKRGVGFDKVEEIFKDMTDAGGIFYNMQEKQGETLFGMWAKLGDAASVMYDKIGNTGAVNNAMKSTIGLMTDLMRNWKATAVAMASLGGLAGLGMLRGKAIKKGEGIVAAQQDAANAKASAATEKRIQAEERLREAIRQRNLEEYRAQKSVVRTAREQEAAAMAEQKRANGLSKLGAGLKSIGSSLLTGLGIGVAITAITALIYEIVKAVTKAGELRNELNKIQSETGHLQTQSVDNFKRLLNEFKASVDGSQKQKEVLDEIKRTYKDMIPEESLTIENLKKITNGTKEAAAGYKDLTDAIKAYIEAQQRQKQLDTIGEVIGTEIVDMQGKLRKALLKDGVLDRDEVARFFEAFKNHANDAGKTTKEKFVAAMQEAGVQSAERINKAWEKAINVKSEWYSAFQYNPLNTLFGGGDIEHQKELGSALKALTDAYAREEEEIQKVNDASSVNLQLTIEQQKELEGMTKWIAHLRDVQDESVKGTPVGENMITSKWINQAVSNMKAGFAELGVAWDAGWANLINSNKPEDFVNQMSSIDFEAIIKKIESIPEATFAALDKNKSKMIKFVKEYQKLYEEMVPKEAYVQQIRFKLQQISFAMKDHGEQMQQYMMGVNETSEAYYERLKNGLERYEALAAQLQASIQNSFLSKAMFGIANALGLKTDLDTVNEMIAAIKEMMSFVKPYTPPDKKAKTHETKPSKPEDTRLQDLRSIYDVLGKINERYKEYVTWQGESNAKTNIQKEAMDELVQLNKMAAKINPNLKFEAPTSMEQLLDYYEQILDVMSKLKGVKVVDTAEYAKWKKEKHTGSFTGQRWASITGPLKGADKAMLDLLDKIQDTVFKHNQQVMEQKMKDLAEKISRGKTAREFYEKILSQTGDIDLAASVTLSVYGDTGEGLKKALADQIRELVSEYNVVIPQSVIDEFNNINYRALEKWVRENPEMLGKIEDKESKVYQELLKIAEQGKKDWAKSYEGYLKDIEKAKGYSQKRIDLARTTAEEINRIREDEYFKSDDPEEQARLLVEQKRLIDGLKDKAAKEAAKQEWEAFKDTPMYVQMFDDLEYASTQSLESMQKMLESLKKTWGESLDPQNLKEMQSRLNNISNQLAKRSPFKGIGQSLAKIRALNETYTSQGELAKKLAKNTDELVAARLRLNAALKGERAAEALKGYSATDVEKAKEALKLYEILKANQKALEDESDKRAKEYKKHKKGDADVEWYNSEEADVFNKKIVELSAQMEPLMAQYGDIWQLLKDIAATQGETVQSVQREVDDLEKKNKILGKVNGQYDDQKQNIAESIAATEDYISRVKEVFDNVRAVVEEWSALGNDELWSAVMDGIDSFVAASDKALDVSKSVMNIIANGVKAASGDIFSMVTAGMSAISLLMQGIGQIFNGAKIAKANKEIAKQEKILHQLEYAYDRLQKTQEKLFGGDYIRNYNKQLANLAAQAEAYRKQAEAEKSKGKKADKAAIQDYEDSWRKTMDEIYDMKDDLQEYFLGTDLTSAARDWANAWLEARWSFEDTTEAMKDKFADMVQNMVVQSLLAKVMENALSPLFEMVDELAKDGDLSIQDIAKIAAEIPKYAEKITIAGESFLAACRDAGLDLSQYLSDASGLTGISRDIATASEESINGLAQGINTQNYYIAFVSENVAAIRALMEGGTSAGAGVDLMSLQNEHLSQLPMIEANTRATAERCERAAIACEAIQNSLERMVTTKSNGTAINMRMIAG